jgi:6-phosphogluconolactonase
MNDWQNILANRFDEIVSNAVEAYGVCNIALTGGSSASHFYNAWSVQLNSNLRDKTISIFLGDERFVCQDHVASNFRFIKSALYPNGTPERHQIYPIPTHLDSVEAAALVYEEILPKRLDLVLLSLADDGHIASLFPGSPAVFESEARVVATMSRNHEFARVSISPIGLNAAERVVVLAVTEHKKKIFQTLSQGSVSPSEIPAQLVLDRDWVFGGD